MPDTNTSTPNEHTTFPVLPLKNNVLFPEMMMPLVVARSASIAAVEAASSSEDKLLVVASQEKTEVEEPSHGDLFRFGVLAVIKKMERGAIGLQAIVHGLQRVELLVEEKHEEKREKEKTQNSSGEQTQVNPQNQPFLTTRVRLMAPPQDEGPEIEALHRAILDQAGKIIGMIEPQAQGALGQILTQFKDPLNQVYLMASMLPTELKKEQAILACNTRGEALRLMLENMSHEAQVLELRQKIATQAQSEMSREQREYLLRQQLRAIQQELGEDTAEKAEINELRRQLEEADLPPEVQEGANREIRRLERIPSASPDHQLTRSYLELILELPWKKKTEDNLDLDHAQQILDEDHYNLKDIKERIVEHLAVLKLNPQAKAPILCFVGPPGVGKTSLGKSIARALDRAFERMSLGGLHDEAELRGHRRTYIGAMPGRIIQAIRRCEVLNPLLMLDEVDKIGRDFRGDPTSALLEILDPAQNFEFRDNYLDLPFDLSNVFFITTANTLETIPGPLLDRMEILRLSGYTDDEKMNIARRYLVPRQLNETGLSGDQLTIPDQSLGRMIRRYTREAGVRELERTVGRLCRKAATRIAKGETHPITIGPEDLTPLLGPEKFFQEDARKDLAPGVAAGLAYTPAGGEVLYIEAVQLPHAKDLKLTGKLGDVMKESAQAAQSFIQSWAEPFSIDPDVLSRGVHIHVPAGATPKDGPSAGVTIAVALASLYTGQPVRSDTAMTGEITLSGLVLPVGGIKEKVLAAHRSRIQRVILPRQNENDIDDIPEHVRDGLEFLFADRIEEVLLEAIPDLPVSQAPVAKEPSFPAPVVHS